MDSIKMTQQERNMKTNKTNLSIDLNLLVDENGEFLSEITKLLYQILMTLPMKVHGNVTDWTSEKFLLNAYKKMKNSGIYLGIVNSKQHNCARFLLHCALDNELRASRYLMNHHTMEFTEKFYQMANKIPPYIVKEGIPEALRKLKEQHNLYLVSEDIFGQENRTILKEINQYFDGFIFSSITDVLKPDIRMFIIKNSNIDGPVIMQKHLDMNHCENQGNDILPTFIQTDSIIEYVKQL